MKTVKLFYGSSMVPDWEIYETDATLSDLLSFAFDLQKFYHLTDTKTKEEIISDFIKNHHYKFLTGSDDFIGNVKAKADIEIDLDDFIEILDNYSN